MKINFFLDLAVEYPYRCRDPDVTLYFYACEHLTEIAPEIKKIIDDALLGPNREPLAKVHYDHVTDKWAPSKHSNWLKRLGGAPHVLSYLKQVGVLSQIMKQPSDQDDDKYFEVP